MVQMKLTPEQSEGMPFPVGCPVWYNFPKTSANGTEEGELPLMKRGVVESISFNYGAKDMIYEVVYEDAETGTKITDEVWEHELAYAAHCPVTVVDFGGKEPLEGRVALCEPSASDPRKITYTVIVMQGFQARFETGVDGNRIKYRKANSDETAAAGAATASPAADNARQEHPPEGDNDASAAKVSVTASAADEGQVPTSITCPDSAAESESGRGKEGGSAGGNKNARAPEIVSPLSATPKKKPRVDATLPTGGNLRQQEDRRLPPDRSCDGAGGSRGAGHATCLKMTIPAWLLPGRTPQRNLFFHLIKTGERRVSHVARETDCLINVNLDRQSSAPSPVAPMTITVRNDNKSRHYGDSQSSALQNLDVAREKVLDLLSHYVDLKLRDNHSIGRMIYEVSSSCEGDHRPRDSTSRAVRVRNPGGRSSFMSLLELPFENRGGRRVYHCRFLLQKHILGHVKSMNCTVKVCGDDVGVPLKFSDPHVLVTGWHWQDVDRAVTVVRDWIAAHEKKM